MIGVAALVAALVAGAMSVTACKCVCVRLQADTEPADLMRERAELEREWPAERRELAAICFARGFAPALATQ